MGKLWKILKHSLGYKSSYTKYKYELLIYFSFILCYGLIGLVVWFVDGMIEKYSILYRVGNMILGLCVLLLFFQTIYLPCRLLEVKTNKFDLDIISGNRSFNNESVSIDYKDFKKIVRNVDFCIKFFIKAKDDSIHMIKIEVFIHKRKELLEKRFYFDNLECGYEKTLLLINEKNMIFDNKILLIGSDLKTINKKIINEFVEYYCKK